MTMLLAYEQAVACGDIVNDNAQRQVLAPFDALAEQLNATSRFWFRRPRMGTIKGIYLYGEVGGGKTYLMDLFYQQVISRQKQRMHFHLFMQQVDGALRQLQGQPNPLQQVAKKIAQSASLLCLDEFFVTDIADAMILGTLLEALFAHQVVLVTTSNIKPDDLYLNGLQRARFLPAIALLKQHCQLLYLSPQQDYRTTKNSKESTYYVPLNKTTTKVLEACFERVAKNGFHASGTITVQQRAIPYIRCAGRAIWFDFRVLCHVPRSQLDYLELAARFDVFFVSDIPPLGKDDTAAALLFMHFIDVMYDAHKQVFFSAALPWQQLYCAGVLMTSFSRTVSRIEEMQSVEYNARFD